MFGRDARGGAGMVTADAGGSGIAGDVAPAGGHLEVLPAHRRVGWVTLQVFILPSPDFFPP